MRASPFEWFDQLFHCVDIGIARFLRISPPLRLDPSLATALLTMSLVVGGFEIIALVQEIFGAAVTSSNYKSAAALPSAQVIIVACAVVWFVISYRCVYRGARETLHRRFDAATSNFVSKQKSVCVLFFFVVYAVLPLLLNSFRHYA